RWQVDDVVNASAERLDPFQLGRVADNVVRHRWRKAQQNVDVADIGVHLVVVADHIDGQLRKAFQQHRLVAGAHGFLDFGKDKDVGHGGRRYSASPRKIGTRFRTRARAG